MDKPGGITSAGVVRRVKRRVGRRVRVGHVGTLDPFATGLLPVCVGEATKVARYLSGASKGYIGRVVLGVETDTLDPTGTVTAEATVPPFPDDALDTVAAGLLGPRAQRPPMYSAIKRDGVPLYRLARQGASVDREAREVRIDALRIRKAGEAALDIEVECSKGTYVRVLASDIAQALGTVGHLGELRRVRVGGLSIARAEPLDSLVEEGRCDPLPLVPIREALRGMREEGLTAEEVSRLRLGQQAPLDRLPGASVGTVAMLLDDSEVSVPCGIAEVDPSGRWRLVRLIHGDTPLLG